MLGYMHLHHHPGEHSVKMDQTWLIHLLEEYGIHRIDDPLWVINNGGLVIIQGAEHADKLAGVLDVLYRMPWAVVLVTSDEESLFPFPQIRHSDTIRWFVQTPRHRIYPPHTRFLPLGSGTYHRGHLGHSTEPLLSATARPKWAVFRGQVQNAERAAAVEWMRQLDYQDEVVIEVTEGFHQGIPRDDYLAELEHTTFAICPPGTQTHDTFRLYEALEAGAIPIVCNKGPLEWDRDRSYWRRIGMGWLPTVSDWNQLPGTVVQLCRIGLDGLQEQLHQQWVNCKDDLLTSIYQAIGEVQP